LTSSRSRSGSTTTPRTSRRRRPALPIDLGSSLNAANARRLYQANPWPGNNYNAVQQLVQPKPLAIINADMNGKFGGTNFFASVNRTDQGGSVRFLDGYTRNSARLNVNQVLGSAWNVSLNTFFARAEEDGLNQEGGGAAFFRLTRTPPIVDLTRTDSRGRLLVRPNIQGGGGQNENALYSLQNINRLDVTNRFVGSLATKYTPFTWLNADATLGYDNQDVNGRQFVDRGYRTTGPTASPGTNLTAGNNGLLLNYAENRRSVNGATGITIPNATPMISGLTVSPNVRFQYLQRDFGDRIARGSGLTVSGVEDLQNATQGTLTTSASRTSERQLTYSGGLRLEYKEPYVLDMNIRRDGNSAFGEEERWATYGRIAGTYVVSSEPFWEPISDKVNLLQADRELRHVRARAALQRAVRDLHDRSRRHAHAAHARQPEPQAAGGQGLGARVRARRVQRGEPHRDVRPVEHREPDPPGAASGGAGVPAAVAERRHAAEPDGGALALLPVLPCQRDRLERPPELRAHQDDRDPPRRAPVLDGQHRAGDRDDVPRRAGRAARHDLRARVREELRRPPGGVPRAVRRRRERVPAEQRRADRVDGRRRHRRRLHEQPLEHQPARGQRAVRR
jgi:hypothetical protein